MNILKKLKFKFICPIIIFFILKTIMIIFLENAKLPYKFIFIDEIKFLKFSKYYSTYANSIIDVVAYDKAGYLIGGISLSKLWFWIVGIIRYLFKEVYYIRIFNSICAVICSLYFYDIIKMLKIKKEAYKFFLLFLFFPYMFIISSLLVKDQLVMLCFIYMLKILVKIRKKIKISIIEILILIIYLSIAKSIRGGLSEIFIIFYAYSFLKRGSKKKIIKTFIFTSPIFIMLILKVLPMFLIKINDYIHYGRGDSAISFLRIDKLLDFYKAPLLLIFGMIQPMPTSLEIDTLLEIMCLLNILLIPIAVGAFISLFIKADFDNELMIMLLLLYISVLILSVGIFRHYYFLQPVTFLMFNKFHCYKTKRVNNIWKLSSFFIIFIIFSFNFMRIL